MKVICCVCGIDIGDKPSDYGSDDTISHGYCESCAHHFIAQMGMSLPEYLEGVRAPVVTVTQEGAINYANSKALSLLGKSLAQIQGFKGGDVFECEYARLPEGCGQTTHCSGCTIRNTVMDTVQTGTAHERVLAYLQQHTDVGTRHVSLTISTEKKKGGVVFLRVDAINEVAPTNG